jgi:hypothetical protein
MAKQNPPPRGGEQRKADVLTRLAEDEDVWVSTAGTDGEPCLVPLSFVWHDGALVMTTRTANPTTVNIAGNGRATVALGHTRDVVLIEAAAGVLAGDELHEAAEAFAAKNNWDTRGRPDWCYLRFRPRTVRAWREANELAGRYLMKEGAWIV